VRYKEYTFKNSAQAYDVMLGELVDCGNDVDSRLGKTKEISSVINLHNPLDMVSFPFGRRFNYFGMLMESLWPLTRIDNAKLLSTWNSRLPDFADDGEHLFGAYGPRLNYFNLNTGEDNITTIISMLSQDRFNRQAVLPIIRPDDVGMQTKDFPCNLLVMFKVRPIPFGDPDEYKLHMTVVNRSNDIHWGLMAVNFPQFAMLQNYIAHSIGVQVGEQTHVSDSLHLYLESEPHKIITERMSSADMRGRYFNFRNIQPRVDPFEIFPEDGHTENYIERILTSIVDGTEFDCSGLSTFLRSVGGILSVYPLVKEDRFKAVVALRQSMMDWLNNGRDRNSDDDELALSAIPVEWLFGAYATIVQGAPKKNRKTLALQARDEFMMTLEAIDSIMKTAYVDDTTYYTMLDFLEEG